MINLAHSATILAHSDRKLARLALCATLSAILAVILAGCAQNPSAEPVAPVKVEVTDHDFCQIMRRVAGASGKLTWSTADTTETIHGLRRLAEAYDKRCASTPANTSPTS